ncbi:OmpA family protein [Alphaproteobacteria bacterium KMM 3653]|uniref:OmpA family protein n=1 Tax=Harenicola maris TaxID=2841044 RepID=A0AAP2CMX2_9RHOB|nr:OmpA family protein [Harenicola maris]
MIRRAAPLATSLALTASLACANSLTLEFPSNARKAVEQVEAYGSYKVPISGFQGGTVQSIWAEGEVRQQAWQVTAPGVTTLQLLAPLRRQLTEAGFEVIYECETRDCGGFDFRYATEVLPEPDMHVDLGDFRFLATQRMGAERPEYVSLMISRSSGRGFVQVVRVGPEQEGQALVTASSKNALVAALPKLETQAVGPVTGLPLIEQLETHGRAVLDDLRFQTGSSQLGEDEFTSLQGLAAYLITNPNRSVVLVGHTDAEGSLAGNISLSRKRAGAVRSRLTGPLGVPAAQVNADGVGFLSPLTTNLTEAGRTLNRRVEVILSSTE